jgi:hypothetical protein
VAPFGAATALADPPSALVAQLVARRPRATGAGHGLATAALAAPTDTAALHPSNERARFAAVKTARALEPLDAAAAQLLD